MAAPDPFALTLDQLRARTSQKWRTFDPDVLPLWVAEMDVAIAEPVVTAVTESMRTGDTGYSMPSVYIEALRRFAAERWEWGFGAADARGVADVMTGIGQLIRDLSDPGDRVVLSPPVYPPFFAVTTHTRRTVVEAPLRPDGRLDLDAIDRTFAAGAKVYLLCNPHNPTGVVHTRDELTALAACAERHGVRVIADEIWAPLVLPGHAFVPYLTIPGTETAFSLVSATKGWNLAALKGAMVVAGAAGRRTLAGWPHLVTDAACHMGVIAQVAALTHGADWLAAAVAGIDANADLLTRLLARHVPAVAYDRPQGTYLAWLDFRACDLGDDPADTLMRAARVGLSPGPWFGSQGRGHARLNLATSPEILTEAIRRVGEVVPG